MPLLEDIQTSPVARPQVRIVTDLQQSVTAGADARRMHEAGVLVRTDRDEFHMCDLA